MIKRILFLNLFVITLLVSNSLAGTFKLPDTGQTTCSYGGTEIACPSPGNSLAQDGSYNINPLSYKDNFNGTVTDNNTGLIWQKQDDGQTYNWYQASGIYDETYNPDSQNICAELDTGGYYDWRLPTKKELISIVNYGVAVPYISSHYFPEAQNSYWTSTINPCYGNPLRHTTNGYFWISNMWDVANVRCVRGPQYPAPKFRDNKNGTVTDTTTGLMWQKGEGGTWVQGSSTSYCENLPLANYTDWRLPNVKELEFIVDDSTCGPNRTFFPNAASNYYWSSTYDIATYGPTWAVWNNFIGNGVTGIFNVRCVRGGSLFTTVKDDSHVAFVKVAVDLAPGSGPDIITGHAWIEVIDLLSGTRKTWGTWEDADSLFGSLYPNRELNRSPAASRSLFVTKKQYDNLMVVVDKYESKDDHAWSLLNNCTAFAKDGWKSVSGEKIDTYFIEDLGFPRPIWPNPISAMYSIIDLNGGFSDRTINKCDSPYCASTCPPPAIFCN